MELTLSMRLPQGWNVQYDVLEDEGEKVQYAECNGPAGELVEVYVGQMPDDSDACDQAFANYVEMVGMDEEMEESPILQWAFDKKTAYGFDALTEEDHLMRVFCVEVKQHVLAVVNMIVTEDKDLDICYETISRSLRVSKN